MGVRKREGPAEEMRTRRSGGGRFVGEELGLNPLSPGWGTPGSPGMPLLPWGQVGESCCCATAGVLPLDTHAFSKGTRSSPHPFIHPTNIAAGLSGHWVPREPAFPPSASYVPGTVLSTVQAFFHLICTTICKVRWEFVLLCFTN